MGGIPSLLSQGNSEILLCRCLGAFNPESREYFLVSFWYSSREIATQPIVSQFLNQREKRNVKTIRWLLNFLHMLLLSIALANACHVDKPGIHRTQKGAPPTEMFCKSQESSLDTRSCSEKEEEERKENTWKQSWNLCPWIF